MNDKGQSLVEVMVALSVAIVVMTAIVMSVVVAIANSQFSKSQNLASHYARQGIEHLRQLSRTDWNNFTSYSSQRYCLTDDFMLYDIESTTCGDSRINNFKREVEIYHESDDCAVVNSIERGSKVVAIVSWNDGKCQSGNLFCHEVRLDSCLRNINLVPTP